jgi:hypothetical protein
MDRILTIELTDEEYDGLEKECRRQEEEDGIYLSGRTGCQCREIPPYDTDGAR